MDGYSSFAEFYDTLTSNIDYKKRAAYFHELIQMFGNSNNILLDLACGTGSLAIEMADLGYDVIGIDRSTEMLSIAMNKSTGKDIIYVAQQMQELELPGKVSVVVSALDSINHLCTIDLVKTTFKKVSGFLEEDGLFIFDVNTEHKQRDIIGDNVFVYEKDEVFCIWRNFYDEKEKKTEIFLDFFKYLDKDQYERYSEEFVEVVYSEKQLEEASKEAGLKIVNIYHGDSLENAKKDTERAVYLLRKE